MLRLLFSGLMLIHGIIHLVGFLQAFGYRKFIAIAEPVSRTVGIAWLMAALLFFIATMVFLFNSSSWWMIALPAMFISQILILMVWNDARFGTIINIFVAFVIIITASAQQFDNKTNRRYQLINSVKDSSGIVTESAIAVMPAPVQRWLKASLVIGGTLHSRVVLKQTGSMLLKPGDTKWVEAIATQHFNFEAPAFVWAVDMKMGGWLPVKGRDEFFGGRGRMLIKMFSLINVADQTGAKLNQASMQRFLAEICWNPDAALRPYIQWQPIDDLHARATMNYKGTSASVVFSIDKSGHILAVNALRYKDVNASKPEQWEVKCSEFQPGSGIPLRAEATWKLPDGDFTWFKLHIESIDRY